MDFSKNSKLFNNSDDEIITKLIKISNKKVIKLNAYKIYVKELMEVLNDLQKDIPEEERPTIYENIKRISKMWQEKKEEECD